MTDTLITGSGGFIGSKLLKRLGNAAAIRHHEIPMFKRDKGFNRFFFLSTYGNMAYHDGAEKILEANIADLMSVLKMAMAYKDDCELFVYVSSSSVSLPVQTPYSRTKLAGEQIVLASGLPACIVRPFTTIGVGEQKEHLIPRLIESCFVGTPMDLVMDATHDFVDVDDVVRGLEILSDAGVCGVFELGTGWPTTNGQVCKMVESVTGLKASIRPVNKVRDYDTMDWFSRDRSAQKLGWKPTKTLSDSIREMVEAYKHE